MTGYLLQQHPVLEKPSFHPYPPIISLFHHTQVVGRQAFFFFSFFFFWSWGPPVRGFVSVPLRLRSNWPHPDASVENSAARAKPPSSPPTPLTRLHLVRLTALCELTGLTVMVCKSERSYSSTHTRTHARTHLRTALSGLVRSLQRSQRSERVCRRPLAAMTTFLRITALQTGSGRRADESPDCDPTSGTSDLPCEILS